MVVRHVVGRQAVARRVELKRESTVVFSTDETVAARLSVDSSASSPKKSPFFRRRETSSAEPTLVHLTSPERIR